MRALRFAGAVALASLAAVGSAFGGCGGDAFTAGSGDGSTVDRQGDDGSGSGGGDGANGDGANDGPTIVPGQTVYVAVSGHDTNSGLDPLHPVHSVKQGLHVAQGLADGGVMLPKVLVCVGDYFENSLQVTFDVGLYGGWDCTTNPSSWARGTCLPSASPSPYCFPTFTKGTTSNIDYANTGIQESTLSIFGDVTSATEIDGFTISGATSAQAQPGGSVGVDISGPAAPKLSNLAITGGGGTATGSSGASGGIGSVGLRLLDSSAPQVGYCAIDGGTGSGPTGSAGIHVNTKGTPILVGDVVSGGSGSASGGSSDVAAVGLDVLTPITGATAPQLLAIVGSDPMTAPNGTTIGVRVGGTNTNLDLSECVVGGGAGSAGEGIGVKLESGGTYHLTNDRIWGGMRGASQTYGVWASGAASVQIVNSEIHGGDVTSPTMMGAAAVGVDLGPSITEAQLVFDTIYSGATSGSTAVNVESGAKGVTIEDDLILGDGTGLAMGMGDPAITAATCTGQIARLDYTGFVNSNTLLKCEDTTTMTTTLAPTPPGISGAIDGSATLCTTTCHDVEVYNPTAVANCSSVAWCVPDGSCPASPSSCLPTVLGTSWTSAQDGAASLGMVTGADAGATSDAWQIESPANACKLTKGGTMNALATKDLLGNTRSSTPTLGAVEYSGSCSN